MADDGKSTHPNSLQRTAQKLRRRRVAEIVRDGVFRSSDIAAEFARRFGESIHPRTVRRDMDHVNEWLRRDAVEYLQTAIARELVVLDKLQREAMAAWERSKLPSEIKRMVKRTPAAEAAGEQGAETTLSVEQTQPVGDPRYLAEVRQLVERKCKLFGLDAPEKIDLLFASQQSPGVVTAGAPSVSEYRKQLLADADYLEYLRERAGAQDAERAGPRLGLAGPDGSVVDAGG